jgi:hypothetical protein
VCCTSGAAAAADAAVNAEAAAAVDATACSNNAVSALTYAYQIFGDRHV